MRRSRKRQRWRWLRVSAGTLAESVKRFVPLFEPLAGAILAHQNSAPVRHVDETGWRVQAYRASGRSSRAWLWTSVSADAVYYLIDPSRSAEVPKRLFASLNLGHTTLVGAQMRYAVHARNGTALAMHGFSTAAWKLAPRDEFIGWSPHKHEKNLSRVIDNPRFLILPWIRIPNLLALVRRRLPRDWTERYNTTPVLIETFVETPRYTGAVYRASGWIHVGNTQGWGRYDRHAQRAQPKKDIWLRTPSEKTGDARSIAKFKLPVTPVKPAHQCIAIPRPPNAYLQNVTVPPLGDEIEHSYHGTRSCGVI